MHAVARHDELLSIEHVLDALNCGAAILDRTGQLVFANAHLGQMIGRNRDQLHGQNVRALYSLQEDLDYIEAALSRSDVARESEFVLPRADGTRLPVMTSSKPLARPFDHLHVVTFVDISAQKRAEDELKENLELLKQVGDNALEHAMELKGYSETLEKKVGVRTEELRAANLDAIYMLAIASEAKDLDTGRHVRRIQKFAETLARRVGVSEHESHEIGYAAILHDVGKIHIPDQILKKPGPLDEDERFTMRQHTLFGERILSKRPFFDRARRIARSHHENWDGSGYPDGLAGDQIPLEARIVRVVDVYDALTTKRIYKPAWPRQQAIEFIEQSAGLHFDPSLSSAFVELHRANAFIASDEVAQAFDDI